MPGRRPLLLPSPPVLRGRGVGGEGVCLLVRPFPLTPTPLPRRRGRGAYLPVRLGLRLLLPELADPLVDLVRESQLLVHVAAVRIVRVRHQGEVLLRLP